MRIKNKIDELGNPKTLKQIKTKIKEYERRLQCFKGQ